MKKGVKQAQVSIFIILGLILLISTSIFFYNKSRHSVFTPEKIVDFHSTPITSYVDACVKYSAQKAIIKLGRQGGYLTLPVNIKNDPFSHISLYPNNDLPFWYFQGQSRIPSLERMEQDLASYVQKDAYKCIDQFRAFSNEYNIDILDNLSVSCKITSKTVQFDSSYPVDIIRKSNNQKIELRDYKSVLNVRLKDSWEMSKRFVEQDLKHSYLSNMTMLIVMIDPKIPLDGLEFKLHSKKWSLLSIKDELYNMVNLAFATKVRFKFNDPSKPFSESKKKYESLYSLDPGKALSGDYKDVPKDFYDYKHFYYSIFDGNNYNKLVSSVYLAPKKYFLITSNPNKNGYLYSSTQKMSKDNFIPTSLFIQFWHFLYNIYYPVIFTVKDPYAFNNQGFIFRIAYPVSIRDNRAAQKDFISFSKFQFTPTKDACDVSKGFSRKIRVETRNLQHINPFSQEPDPINDVELYYECPTSTCYLGNTTFSRGTFGLDAKLPTNCVNGIIVARKPGFITKKMQAITTENLFTLDMVPLHRYQVNITPLTDYQVSENETLKPYDLSRYRHNATVAVLFKSYNYSYETSISYDFKNPVYVNLSAGKYKVDSYVILDDSKNTYIGGYSGNLTIRYYLDPAKESDTDKTNLDMSVFVQVPMPRTDDDIYKVINNIKKYNPYMTPKIN